MIIGTLFVPTAVLAQDGIELIVHFVEGTLIEDKVGYDVSIHLSALQSGGSAINGLTKDEFRILEDSKQVEIEELSNSSDLPISVLLLVDTSGSMQGTPIQNAIKSSINFIDSMKKGDEIAVVSFNEEIQYLSDFSENHQKAKAQIDLLEAENMASTCLYDAAFSAVEKVATLESGRRMIILLTDGQDYKSGSYCSIHTIDDVLNIASSGNSRVPLYTIGLSDEVDEKSLERLSDMTGGVYHYAPSSVDLQSTFNDLSSQLRSQYVLKYTSTAAPGSHMIAVEMKFNEQTVQDTRAFMLPELPAALTFISPSEGQSIDGNVKIAATLSGSYGGVEKVIFSLGETEVASDATVPYELDFRFSEEQLGPQILIATAINADGEMIVSDSVGIIVRKAPKTEEISLGEKIKLFFSNPINIVLGFVGLVVVVVGVIAISRKLKKAKTEFSEDFELREASRPGDDRTIDISMLRTSSKSNAEGSETLATLTILHSADAGMIGQKLSITKFPTSVGRSPENDIVISKKDQPVSRNHIIIDKRRGNIILMENIVPDSSGNPKPPTYGTFVNEKKVSNENVLLRDGDEIRLGSRFRMRFSTIRPSSGSEDRKLDGISFSGDGKTREIKRDGNGNQELPKD